MEKKLKLLLVDDEPYVCRQVANALDWEAMDIEVIGICKSAIDAVDKMIEEAPHILITDIQMPIMNGLDLIAKAKQINPDLESLILSGYAEFSYAQTAVSLKVNEYLLKPFSKEELEEALQKLCEQVRNKLREKQQLEEIRQQFPEVAMSDGRISAAVIEYTKKHYAEERLNLQLIADQVIHLGVRHVGRQFQKETGLRYSEYLTKIRMEKAKYLLTYTVGVEDVAEQIGLGHDIPYFYRLFKKYEGITPKEYKEKNRKTKEIEQN